VEENVEFGSGSGADKHAMEEAYTNTTIQSSTARMIRDRTLARGNTTRLLASGACVATEAKKAALAGSTSRVGSTIRIPTCVYVLTD
jgi:hypothetical protein